MRRENNLTNWLKSIYPKQNFELKFAASDADHRKYYRLILNGHKTLIIMDAPTDKINIEPYIYVQQLFQTIQVPDILHINKEDGFIVLQDFGDNSLINLMLKNSDPNFHKSLLNKAIEVLVKLQRDSQRNKLPVYSSEKLDEEMNLFVEWCLPHYYGKELNNDQAKIWQASKIVLLNQIHQQGQVYVHRDYIIRNLMLLEDNSIGVLDFQDAVWGSVCYDIASLMRDAFIEWDEEFTLDIVIRYWEQAKKCNIPVDNLFDDFYKNYEWIAVQRHLKVAGIFTRLKFRDNKDKYISEVPRFINYLKKTTRRYSGLHPLYNLLIELTGKDENLQTGFTF